MNEEEAIDILKNCIADYVIGEYCSKCEDSQICESKNEDCYYLQSIDAVLNLLEKKDRKLEEIQKEVREHIGFENRLKRDNREPDLFNQGIFYVANNINNILKGKLNE